MMYFHKRYEYVERDEDGKLSCIGEFSTPEEFEGFLDKYPLMKGHTATLCDLCSPLDDFGLSYATVREIIGE